MLLTLPMSPVILAAGVFESFKRALDAILARVFVSAPGHAIPRMAVGCSGGLDSSVLLQLAQTLAHANGIKLFAFHIHHGLSPNADAWLAHCQAVCERLGIAFDFRRVAVNPNDRRGLESAARAARYAALGELCRQNEVPVLLLAQHQDDQAETVLLQLLRGAGLGGLSGMDEAGSAPELLGGATPILARPLLSVTRAALEDYAHAHSIAHIEDESNQSLRHPRNVLRNQVLPQVATYFPAYRDCLARGAQHAQSAQGLLDDLAELDWIATRDGAGLDVARVKQLKPDRIANLLRYWLATNGSRPPSSAWLHEARTQLLDARADAQVCVSLEGVELRRYRNRMVIVARDDGKRPAPQTFRWQGEASLAFANFGGTLFFDPDTTGLVPDWLRTQDLRLQYRAGGGKLKLAAKRHTRSLKDLYQERAIPAWERSRLPLLYAGESLLFAAGLGQDCRFPGSEVGSTLSDDAASEVDAEARGIRLRWQPDA